MNIHRLAGDVRVEFQQAPRGGNRGSNDLWILRLELHKKVDKGGLKTSLGSSWWEKTHHDYEYVLNIAAINHETHI